MPRVPLASADEKFAIGSARLKAKITTPIPINMVVGMLISVSTSHLMFNRFTTRCSSQGIRNTFSNKVMPADRYRWGCPVT